MLCERISSYSQWGLGHFGKRQGTGKPRSDGLRVELGWKEEDTDRVQPSSL